MLTGLDENNLMDLKLTGLFGDPVEHSLSPVMHNSAFRELGLNYLYLPFAVAKDELGAAVQGIRALNFRGVNLTIPHKEEVGDYLDQISREAELIGAINTICLENDKLKGYNTDGQGFLRSLEEEAKFKVQGKKVLLIGAGGASRALAYQLALEGIAELYIANRTLNKAQNLISEVKSKMELSRAEALALSEQTLAQIMKEIDLVVDTTPVGMSPHSEVEPLIGAELLHSNLLVADLVYNPLQTTLLKAARSVGAETLGGLGMLLYQGAIAFEIWTGEEAPIEVMKKALEVKR